MVNSCHHQGVKQLADCLDVVAYSDDSLVEAFVIKDYPFGLGVQWHPERDHKTAVKNKDILDMFIKICSK